MPIKTPHFGLEAFIPGDQYSASVDKRRMTIIDSHMGFLSDLIGPGIIDGWELSEASSLTLKASSGWGMIDKNITRTFGDYYKTLLDNNKVYVWMRRRAGVIGQTSAFSDIGSVSYTDTTPPSTPISLAAADRFVDSVSITWTSVFEVDFAKYRIYRSLNNIDFSLISESLTGFYLDSGLDSSTGYYYRITSVDKSGNESPATLSLLVSTLADNIPPADPTSVQIVAAKEALLLSWKFAPFGHVAAYRIYVTPVTIEGVATGSTFTKQTLSTKRDITISDLTNGQRYRVVLKSVGTNGFESDGVIKYSSPLNIDGPFDVSDVDVTDEAGNGVLSNVKLDISWTPFIDPYDTSPATSYEVRLQEFDGNGGTITSEWVSVPSGFSRQFEVYPYKNSSGTIVYKSIEPRTQYTITIRAVSLNGLKSVGKTVYYNTRSFSKPAAPTLLTVTQASDRSLVYVWYNSVQVFDKNLVTVEKISSSSTEVIVSRKDIGKSSNYILTASYVVPGFEYRLTLVAVDEFDNESDEQQISFSIPDLSALPLPPIPPNQFILSGDRQVTIIWSPATIEYVSGYRIYRAEESVSYSAADFVRLDTVGSSISSYTDYGLDNTLTYIYFVTTVDIFGKESKNPVDDGFFDYSLLIGSPVSNGDLPYPSGLSATAVGQDANLTWNVTGGLFDGIELFRSKDNKYSFLKIANLPASSSSYTDLNVLTETSTYYYIIRKFRNEADLFVTESAIDVSGAIFIGQVITSQGVMSFDITGVRHIKNLHDPIIEETDARLAVHKHRFFSEADDRRINLGSLLTVSDWTTDDFQHYTTTTDISQATTYNVFLNGLRAESYSVFFTLDPILGVLTFENQLALGDTLSDPNATYPFPDPPVVEVRFENLTEVQDELPKERLEGASAQQVNVGLVDETQMPVINHDGRINEILLPSHLDTIAVDAGYRFAPKDENQTVGDAIVWYDVLYDSDENILVSGTSDGIYTSPDFGLTWTRRFDSVTPVSKIFHSPTNKFYFALTNRGVLGSGGTLAGFGVWQEIPGLENSKITRDIAEDDAGNVFCTSDLGVFKLVKDVTRGSFFWQQTPIFGPRSTESFAICFDSDRSRVIVSNELGIFETTNEGSRWDFSNELSEQRPFFALTTSGSTIYGLTRDSVWRRNVADASFKRLARIPNVSTCRKFVVWKSRIYITTEDGLFVSDPAANILSDETIVFSKSFLKLNFGAYSLPPTSLNVIDGKLFIGTEERLFIAENHGKLMLQSEFSGKVVPTVYINGVEQVIGYRFSTTTERIRQCICFDQKLNPNDVVTFVNQYQNYETPHGGWTDCDFGSKVIVSIDGIIINRGSLAEKPATVISTMTWPNYTDLNANKATADTLFAVVRTNQTNLLALSQNDPKVLIAFDKPHVNMFLFSVERFVSQLYPEARVVQDLDSNGNPVFVDASGNVVPSTTVGAVHGYSTFKIPDFNVVMLSYDETFRTFGLTEFGHYNELYTGTNGLGSFGTELDGNGSAGGTVGFSYDTISPLSRIKPPHGWPEHFSKGKNSTDITDYRGTDPIDGFGLSRYPKSFGGIVGDRFDDDYGKYFVVVTANSLNGTFRFKTPLKKYNKVQADITNPSFSNTQSPHWVIEDTFEWVNSGTPSHLSQVMDSNIDYMGIAIQKSNPLLMDKVCPPYQGKYIIPCIYDWYDRFNSTVDYKLHDSFGNAGRQIAYPNAVMYVKDLGQVLVGGYGGVISVGTTDYSILPVDIDSRRQLFIKDLYLQNKQVYVLDQSALYLWDLLTGKITRDRGLGLPDELFKVSVMLTGNLIITGRDGIYARKPTQDSWQKVVSTNASVEVLATPDAAFAIDGSGDIWYSTEGFFWTKIGNAGNLVINQIVKYKSQIFVATDKGAYSDYGTFYSGHASLSLINILNDLSLSSTICVNSISSNSDESIFGLSDGRYVIMGNSFNLYDNSMLDTIHKILPVEEDLWLFGFDIFRIKRENLIRRLATGSAIFRSG